MSVLSKGERDTALLAMQIAALSQKREHNLAAWAEKYGEDLIITANEAEAARLVIYDEEAEIKLAAVSETLELIERLVREIYEAVKYIDDVVRADRLPMAQLESLKALVETMAEEVDG